jgi:predicted regulator of Ras-like GTPase activity (Roadblock/LC7/MglB family)|eukprot:CAMPEP_0174579558 /NCGR_PEP_ID=MMETSP0929-20130131/1663_1 /TAXON_ID=548131 ORGANISM="Ostreococcus mediterraneus, Strain clade-D-RCC2572" /NCGR_SAMPLE_ID=MMETSP0929 /ASSEMBLY_ACC=CAM_ASM_000573 /LENGTH=142 /DNA_ID=CAMNT_0015760917 /DNA_START=35 /DNA_END=463 /DNA_ORIENTATION=+
MFTASSSIARTTATAPRVARRPHAPRRAHHVPALSQPIRRGASLARAVPLADVALLGIDTSSFDQMVIGAMRAAIPLYMAGAGTLFVVGTIAKVAFPDKFDDAMYGKAAKKEVEGIDLDNLSEEDAAAVAALEAELKAQGKL